MACLDMVRGVKGLKDHGKVGSEEKKRERKAGKRKEKIGAHNWILTAHWIEGITEETSHGSKFFKYMLI